jgi:hypothetical protein
MKCTLTKIPQKINENIQNKKIKKLTAKALTPGQMLRQVWPINLPETRNQTKREKKLSLQTGKLLPALHACKSN